jgi:fatty acid synthase subunit beta
MEETFVPLVELKSEFLIRGSFSDFTSTFSINESKEKIVLQRLDDVKLLRSMTWFKQVSDDVLPVEVGDNLEFTWTTKKTFSDINTISSIELSGNVTRLDASCANVVVATISYKGDTLQESPVELFLSKIPKENVTNGNFAERGYNMLPQPLEINVPESALEYAVASRDLNPIHRSRYAAILAKLPHGKPIMHGMWTATKVRALMVQHFGGSIDSNICSYDANFDGMVYPGDRLFVQVRHIGMDIGKKVLSIEVVNGAGERVVSARAIVQQPPAAFVFTGQGSAEVGMGMDRYAESKVARDTWNAGDAHLQKTFGFSILEIVRKNPTSMTIHFGGKRGRTHRANFMQLTCEDPETGETTPLLPEINKRTQSFTFSAPEGLLFATQFSQPALVLLEKATFAEIQAAQLVPRDALFAGHSLGEYAGLAAFASALPIENVVEVVFLRGLIMQRAVKRDASGRSDYGIGGCKSSTS